MTDGSDRKESIHVRGDPSPSPPPRRFVERKHGCTYSPPGRTASPDPLDTRYSRRSTYRDEFREYYDHELRYLERDRTYYEDRSRSPSRQRYREPLYEREREREYYDPPREPYNRRSPSRRVIVEETYESQEEYGPPEKRGKSLKFDVNLLSLASNIKDNQAIKVLHPTKASSIDKPEIVLIET
jgi:hypothetical protein